MIHTNRTVAVGDQESKIDSPIILYRGDREVEVEFTINGSKFTFTNGGNVIKSTNATHGQLVINTPTGENMFSEVTECHDGKVVFVITKEMIDELIEVGFYSFQIRLFDESQVSRVTIPPVLKGIDIRNPIAAEDETNVVDIGLVDYAVVVKDEFEDLSTFLPDGNYNKTEWESKDVISGAKLNKIEDALYNITSNMEATDLALLNRIEREIKDIKGDIKYYENEMNNIHCYDSVESMKAGILKNGEFCETLGYYSYNDGGGSKYKIVDDAITPNDIDIIPLNNGLKAVYINDGIMEVRKFGVKEGLITNYLDRISNRNRIQRCIDFCLENNVGEIHLNGYYRVETEVSSEYAFVIRPDEGNITSKLNVYVDGSIQAYGCSVFLIENLKNSFININLKHGGNIGNEEETTGVQFYNCRNLDITIKGDNFAGTLVRMGSYNKPVNESTCSIDCYGGYRCLIHGEIANGRQQFFGVYSHVYYDNTTKGSIIYNSDDVHFLHFENRFIGGEGEHALQIINSTTRFTYLGLGENARFLTYVKGDSGSVCTATIDKYFCANKLNSYGLVLEGFIHCNVGYLEDSGCNIIVDIRNPLEGSFINIDTFMTKKIKNDRICVRCEGSDANVDMRGGSYRYIL